MVLTVKEINEEAFNMAMLYSREELTERLDCPADDDELAICQAAIRLFDKHSKSTKGQREAIIKLLTA